MKSYFGSQVVTFGPKVKSPKLEHGFKVSRINRVVLSDNLVVPSRHEIVVQCLLESDTPEELGA